MKLVSKRLLTPIFATVIGLSLSAGVAMADVAISGDVEINQDFASATAGKTTATGSDVTTSTNTQGGRTAINFSSRKEMMGMFAEGKGTLEIGTGSYGQGDMWFKYGNADWDVQAGYFEGFGVYSKGNDVTIADAGGPSRYEGKAARGRGPGGIALHLNGGVNVELGLQIGAGDDITGTIGTATTTTTVATNRFAIRPAISTEVAGTTIEAAFETVTDSPQNGDSKGSSSTSGYVLHAGGDVSGISYGVNLASGTVTGKTVTDADTDEKSTTTVGFHVGISDFTVGVNSTSLLTKSATSGVDDLTNTHLQTHLSYAMPLAVEGAKVQFGYSVASAVLEKANANGDDVTNSASNLRIRLNYAF